MTTPVGLLVVGGGPAGITAALRARELGVQVTLLEADQVGGTSLNRGPAPVRTLARAARLARDWSAWARFGLEGPPPVPNLQAILATSDRVARYAHEKKHMADHLRHHGVDLVEQLGPVRFSEPHTLGASDGRSWQADRIILAVGGHAARLPIPGDELALTYSDIRTLRNLPATAAVIGAADTGCQIASVLVDLGVRVILFEAGPMLVPSADTSISIELGRAFQRKGIETHTDTIVVALHRNGDRITVQHGDAASPAESTVDVVFFAVGWPGNVNELALDAAGIRAQRHTIPVDAHLRTQVEHIFAARDVNGHSMLVQVARLEERIAAENAVMGPTRQVTYDVVPSASFTDPEYGQVGLTEADAARDHEVEVGIARYDLPPACRRRPSDGFCWLIADRRQRTILGAHVIGEYSAEIVQVVAACMSAGMSVEQVAELPFAFPTFTEAVSMAAQKIAGASVSDASPRYGVTSAPTSERQRGLGTDLEVLEAQGDDNASSAPAPDRGHRRHLTAANRPHSQRRSCSRRSANRSRLGAR